MSAQLMFGQMLLDGGDQPADPVRAMCWFGIAADAGHVPAMNMLGRCHEKGWGTETDHGRAAAFYRRAANSGDDWGRYNLANMLLRGRGVARDRREAWRLFHAAATSGHAKSMNLVGRFLEEGWDRPRDPSGARVWYRHSAEAGDYRGRHNLATSLTEDGHHDEALGWWRQALPDATPDILHAMIQVLARIDHADAAPLLLAVRQRLAPAPLPVRPRSWRDRFRGVSRG
ncbi:MAG: tetratricopeptide repeat protein [Janthinobacterium lividum]